MSAKLLFSERQLNEHNFTPCIVLFILFVDVLKSIDVPKYLAAMIHYRPYVVIVQIKKQTQPVSHTVF